ncbi:MAG: heparinase II/III family protein [Planctomycetaceae bacterium]|nr:heparinase II/III-family protein [Planctomycetaceae bacterium]
MKLDKGPIMSVLAGIVTLLAAVLAGAPLAGQEKHSVEKASLDRVAGAIKQAGKTHPFLFADEAAFAALKQRCRSETFARMARNRLLADAEAILPLPPSMRKMEGRRLLGVSRQVLGRVSTLAMAYRLTGKAAHLERCAAEMRAAAGFTDWNPSHFLDVAEMTLALAVGYDWLYHDLDAATRQAVAEAILDKGLRPSLKSGGWVGATNNWGQVCHAGMIAGALALMDRQEPLAAQIVHRAIANLPRSMHVFAPNGCYPEGPGYWSYGTDFNVLAIAMLDSVLKSDFALADLPGFAATADYMDLVTGPSGMTFNYADGGAGRGTDLATWWLARRFKRPDILAYFEKDAFVKHCTSRPGKGGNRLFAFTLLWVQDVPDGQAPKAPLCWSSQGTVSVTIQRSSWDNERAIFVGLKAGSPSANHGHMDGGSFVLDADGVRWAHDLGAENYHRIESRKMSLWSSAQNSDRWKIFRLNSLSHNTLTIDGQLQQAKGSAKVVSFRAAPPSRAVLDLTSLYPQASQIIRSGELLESGQYRMTDTIKGLKAGTRVRWAMATKAKPDELGKSSLVLRQGGKQLLLTALHDKAAKWKTYEAAKPANEWDSPNPGVVMVGLEALAPASGEVTLQVLFTPGSATAAAEDSP